MPKNYPVSLQYTWINGSHVDLVRHAQGTGPGHVVDLNAPTIHGYPFPPLRRMKGKFMCGGEDFVRDATAQHPKIVSGQLRLPILLPANYPARYKIKNPAPSDLSGPRKGWNMSVKEWFALTGEDPASYQDLLVDYSGGDGDHGDWEDDDDEDAAVEFANNKIDEYAGEGDESTDAEETDSESGGDSVAGSDWESDVGSSGSDDSESNDESEEDGDRAEPERSVETAQTSPTQAETIGAAVAEQAVEKAEANPTQAQAIAGAAVAAQDYQVSVTGDQWIFTLYNRHPSKNFAVMMEIVPVGDDGQHENPEYLAGPEGSGILLRANHTVVFFAGPLPFRPGTIIRSRYFEIDSLTTVMGSQGDIGVQVCCMKNIWNMPT